MQPLGRRLSGEAYASLLPTIWSLLNSSESSDNATITARVFDVTLQHAIQTGPLTAVKLIATDFVARLYLVSISSIFCLILCVWLFLTFYLGAPSRINLDPRRHHFPWCPCYKKWGNLLPTAGRMDTHDPSSALGVGDARFSLHRGWFRWGMHTLFTHYVCSLS